MQTPGIRRILRHAETDGEGRPAVGWAAAIISDPLAGQVRADLSPLIAFGAGLGERLCREALAALAIETQDCRCYGKGAIVGVASDLEHAAAILHPGFGAPVRALLGRGKAIIPSSLKTGGPGARLDVPLHGIDDEWDFALLGAVEVGVADAPRPGEIPDRAGPGRSGAARPTHRRRVTDRAAAATGIGWGKISW